MTIKDIRPWTWTPSPFMNRMMTLVLKTPLLHRAVSHNLLLLSFTGRKSEQHYTLPIGYWQEGNEVTLLTKRFRTWWRNFEQPAPVELLIGRNRYDGMAQAIIDEEVIAYTLVETMTHHPRQAQIWQIRLDAEGKPNTDDARAIAPKIVVIRINLLAAKSVAR